MESNVLPVLAVIWAFEIEVGQIDISAVDVNHPKFLPVARLLRLHLDTLYVIDLVSRILAAARAIFADSLILLLYRLQQRSFGLCVISEFLAVLYR